MWTSTYEKPENGCSERTAEIIVTAIDGVSDQWVNCNITICKIL